MAVIRLFNRGWNYSQDGRGNRFVYHFQGCNLRCPWCSNPEGRDPGGVFLVSRRLLVPEVCRFHAIRNSGINRSRCVACAERSCLSRNRNQGIRLSCGDFTVAGLVREALSLKAFFFDGGGITVSGGEPTLQFGSLAGLLAAFAGKRIHTAMETNGTHPDLARLFPLIDELFIDFKHWNPEIHERVLGAGNTQVLENIRLAVGHGRAVTLRYTLIPGFNNSLRDVREFIRFAAPFRRRNMKVEFLAYHDFGRPKWAQCGLRYRMGRGRISRSLLHACKELAAAGGLEVRQS